ncbi:MAG TPA: class I SAM-dependent methyltransferase [Falsiroseomonas sp.]|jgi:SAM-dependent methyltransferase|nr:class I SAM-dependent methyltransferase [Falsiroseomonas sp.]
MQVAPRLAAAVRKAMPMPVEYQARRQISLWRGRAMRRRLRRAGTGGPAWLGMEELVALQARYAPLPPYGYSEAAILARGEERAAFLARFAGYARPGSAPRSLEVGCLDGLASAALRQRGWEAAAIDRVSSGYDRRAVAAGTMLLTMDAERLAFRDDSFDLAFSYNAFEHIGDPAAALREMIRATRDGGIIHLSFGPLHNAALGLHAYREIRVPFCQFLFRRETLDAYCQAQGLRPVRYDQLNGWSLRQYRDLWSAEGRRLKRLHYVESWSMNGMDLVESHPECFASKGLSFEELAVEHIHAVFRVTKS